MSLGEDQILRDSYNALDVLGKRVNDSENPLKAAEAVIKYEADIEKTEKEKKNRVEPGKTIVNPEELLRGIRDDMSR